MAGGSYHEYKDIVVVNMMKSVPDGIIVDPNEIQVEYSIVSDAKSTEELPTAQVKLTVIMYRLPNMKLQKVKYHHSLKSLKLEKLLL